MTNCSPDCCPPGECLVASKDAQPLGILNTPGITASYTTPEPLDLEWFFEFLEEQGLQTPEWAPERHEQLRLF